MKTRFANHEFTIITKLRFQKQKANLEHGRCSDNDLQGDGPSVSTKEQQSQLS
jgi:hypothetical protein